VFWLGLYVTAAPASPMLDGSKQVRLTDMQMLLLVATSLLHVPNGSSTANLPALSCKRTSSFLGDMCSELHTCRIWR